MSDDDRELPTSNHPLHGEERKKLGPAVIVLGIMLTVAVIYLVGLWLRYHT